MAKSAPSKSAVLPYSLINLILFKLSWVALVAGQEAWLAVAALLQLGSLWLHPHIATAWRPALLIAATGMAVDQLLVLNILTNILKMKSYSSWERVVEKTLHLRLDVHT